MTPEQLAEIKARALGVASSVGFRPSPHIDILDLLSALESARAELESETRWAKQYHDEAEQLREAVAMNGEQATQLAHENAMLRVDNERLNRIVTGNNEALRDARKTSEDETRRLGYEPGALQMRWRGRGSPPPKSNAPNYWQELGSAICDALTQEGVIAWAGDGTSIVAQMIDAQVKAREKAEVDNARLREAVTLSLDWCNKENSERGAVFARVVNALLAANETGAQQ